jgi:hypothetical protein
MQLETALPIVRSLADGVNPFTGEAYPDHSPYAEPRALRALYSAIDLMSRELAREKRKQQMPVNFGKSWSAEEDAALEGAFDAGTPIAELARRHGRTAGAMRLRLEKLGKIEPSGEGRY